MNKRMLQSGSFGFASLALSVIVLALSGCPAAGAAGGGDGGGGGGGGITYRTETVSVTLAGPGTVYFILTNINQAVERPTPDINPSAVTATTKTRNRSTPLAAGYPVSGRPDITASNEALARKLARSPKTKAYRASTVPPRNEYAIGASFNYRYHANNPLLTVPTTLQGRVVGPVATPHGGRSLYVWVANDSWHAGGTKARLVTQPMVNNIMTRFLAGGGLSDDVYDWVSTIFGAEWGPHSSPELIPYNTTNQEIHIVLYDIDFDNSTTGGVVGYYWAKDNFETTVIPTSNERLIFVIDAVLYATPDSGTWGPDDFWPELVYSTLAHELQHMIHFYQKSVKNDKGPTDTWINEMASMVAEDLVADKLGVEGPRGLPSPPYTAGPFPITRGRLPLFNYWNDIPLTLWNYTGNVDMSYSIAYAFGAYLARNYGGAVLFRDIVQNPYTDFRAVTAAIQSVASESVDFLTLMQRWGEAVLRSDSTRSPPLRYNAGGVMSSTVGSTSYNLGSINLFNYIYDGVDGPWLYQPQFLFPELLPMSNTYVELGRFGPGTHSWQVTLPEDVHVKAVVK